MNDKFVILETSRHIKKKGYRYEDSTPVRKSLPFIQSIQGRYTHRIRSMTLHNLKGQSHFSAKCWCGISFCFGGERSKGKSIVVENPSENRPICATCEGKIIGAGLLGAREINGRSVMYRPMNGESK